VIVKIPLDLYRNGFEINTKVQGKLVMFFLAEDLMG
jgi:hypothetical protein